jgi:polyisoprenoid-binding protein YceI
MLQNKISVVTQKFGARIALAALVIGFAACQPKTLRPPVTTPPVAPTTDTAGAVRYSIDSAASVVHILVYRAGTMARFGHNHVISSRNVTGEVLLHNELNRSQVALTVPVESLIVDEPQSRATEGDDFKAEVPQDARDGTRRNLLRTEVLDVEHFPTITLQSIAISGTRSNPSLLMRITIKGISRDIVTLATTQEQAGKFSAAGEFAIQQTEFGITPFSVGLGALQVQDRLQIKFKLVANRG